MGFRQPSRRVCRLFFHRGTIDFVLPLSHATQYVHADRRGFYRCWRRHYFPRKFIVAPEELKGCSWRLAASRRRSVAAKILLAPVAQPDAQHLGHLLARSEEHTSELQSLAYLVCRLLLEKKKKQ